MSTTAATITIITTVVILVTGIVTAQGFWITREIDQLGKRIDGLTDEMRKGFDRLATKLDNHETRVSRLEGTPS